MRRFILPLLLLSLFQFVITVEMSMVMPLAPILATQYGIQIEKVAMLGIGYSVMGMFSPLIGKKADRFGEKNVLLISSFVFSIGAFLVSVSSTPVGYVIARAVLGIGFFTLLSMITAYTAKILPYEKMGKASGMFKLAFGIGVMLSPIIGQFMATIFSLQELYYSISIAMLSLTLLGLLLPKTSKNVHVPAKEASSKPKINSILLASFLFSIPAIYFYNYLSVYLVEIGNNINYVTKAYTLVGVGTLTAAVLILLISDKLGKWYLLLIGSLLSSVMVLFVYYGDSILLFIFLFGFTFDTLWGLFFPVSSKIKPEHNNYVLSMLSMGMALANTFSGFTSPLVYTHGFIINIWISSISIFIGTIFYYKATKHKQMMLNGK